jgi:hypothetical protein
MMRGKEIFSPDEDKATIPMANNHSRWELGSEHHWDDNYIIPVASNLRLPSAHRLFATGRAALSALAGHLQKGGRRPVLHLPSFFCLEVAHSLARDFEIKWFRDLPDQPGPDFASLQVFPGELVMAVNFFGIRSGEQWRKWGLDHGEAILLEDHTHDPFSDWARESKAHYLFSSLRKTLPLPDGAILSSPSGLSLPDPLAGAPRGALLKLEAMILKAVYVRGGNIKKDEFRKLQIEGEKSLAEEGNVESSSFTKSILEALDVKRLRSRRAANVRFFWREMKGAPNPVFRPLFREWPAGGSPLGAVLVCESREVREKLIRHLLNKNIYAAVHWRQDRLGACSGDPETIDLADRIFTLPVDFRYSEDDVMKVVEILGEFR